MDTKLRELFDGFNGKTNEEKMAVAEELNRIAGLAKELSQYASNRLHRVRMADPLAIMNGVFTKHQNMGG